MLSSVYSKLVLTAVSIGFLLSSPVQAQSLNLKEILRKTPSTQLRFSPFTVGSIIKGGSDRVYTVALKQGNELEVNVSNTGARAAVFVFDKNGKQLAALTSDENRNSFAYKVPSAGNYYIFCYGGPTNHTYSLSVIAE
jgi:Bacterial pre-peptidase C-terminal domain